MGQQNSLDLVMENIDGDSMDLRGVSMGLLGISMEIQGNDTVNRHVVRTGITKD